MLISMLCWGSWQMPRRLIRAGDRIVAAADGNPAWRERRRGADYESAKNRITRALLDLVGRHHPGLGDLVE